MARRASAAEKPNVNPDDIAAAYTQFCDDRADCARAAVRTAANQKRYEKLGVDPKRIKKLYAMDQEHAQEEHDSLAHYARVVGLMEWEKSGQSNVLSGLTVTTPSTEMLSRLSAARAHSDGYNTGRAGGAIEGSERYGAGTEEFVAWRDGWQDGFTDRLLLKPELENVTQAEPRKRGRPPGSKNKSHLSVVREPEIDQTDLEEHIVNAVQAASDD